MYEPIFTLSNLAYLAILAVALIITFLFTPVTRIIAKKTGAVDMPDKERKFHRAPTPRLGGIAILLGFAVTCICASLLIEGEVSKTLLATVVGGVLICLVGMIDDIFNLPAYIKLIAQIGVAALAAFWGGAIEYTTMFGKTYILGNWAIPLTVLWIIVIINAVNLIDGLDGLACGVSFLSAVALLVIAILMGDVTCAILAAALCGAALGFLPYNVSPAAVFMGDSGSTLFGYVLACISVFGFAKGAALMSTVAPAIVFALPVIDVIAAFGSRISENKNPFKPDRSHFHYKLMDIGFSSKQAVTIIYIASAVFCAAAIISLYYKLASLIIAGVACLFLLMLKHINIILPSEVASAKTKTAAEEAPDGAEPEQQTFDFDGKAEKQPEPEQITVKSEKSDEKPPNKEPAAKSEEVRREKSADALPKKKKFGAGRVASAVVSGEAAKKNRSEDGLKTKQVISEKVSLSAEDFNEKPDAAGIGSDVAQPETSETAKASETAESSEKQNNG